MGKITMKGSLPFSLKGSIEVESVDFNGSIGMASVLLSGNGAVDSAGVSKLLNVKLPVNLFHFIDFVASRSNSTRTSVVISLLEAGAQAAFESLSENEQKKFYDDLTQSTFEVELNN